ncbi:MAG: RNA polymerase sigma factor [Mangrovibacterium sp.]
MSDTHQTDQYQANWARFLGGDTEALASIYFDFFDLLLNFGLKYSPDRFLVEDCIQNLFTDILKNRKKQKPLVNLKFYLLKALRNQIATARRNSRKEFPSGKNRETEFSITYSFERSLIARETKEMRRRFLNLVREQLTNRQQEALYLKFTCGFDYSQISELMSISVESARTLIYRTLKSIRESFEEDDKLSGLIFFSLLCRQKLPQAALA